MEDSLSEARLLRGLTERYFSVHASDVSVDCYQTARAFFSGFAPDRYSIALLDCYLDFLHGSMQVPGKALPEPSAASFTGIDVARRIRESDTRCKIVFVTSSRDFAVESYEVHAEDYLLKPITYERLASVFDNMELDGLEPRIVRVGNCEIDANALCWARTSGHYIELHISGGGVLRFRASFAQLQSALSEMPQFYVSARGYLANLDMVEQIEDGEFVLRNGERVPISRRNSAEARAAWADWEARTFDRAHPQSGKG